MPDEYIQTPEQDACDVGWAALNAANTARGENGAIDTDQWKHHIGPLREALRVLEADAPEATSLIGWVRDRVEIYVGHAAWAAQRDHDWRDTESVETGLDTGVLHGPAGRDIRWGCTPIPRFED